MSIQDDGTKALQLQAAFLSYKMLKESVAAHKKTTGFELKKLRTKKISLTNPKHKHLHADMDRLEYAEIILICETAPDQNARSQAKKG